MSSNDNDNDDNDWESVTTTDDDADAIPGFVLPPPTDSDESDDTYWARRDSYWEGDGFQILLTCGENCIDCEKPTNGVHEFWGSRKYLCRESDYFHSMLFGGFSEAKNNTVSMSGVSASALKTLIDWSEGGIGKTKVYILTTVLVVGNR